MASPCHCSPYLWELAPGDLGGPVALDHDGGIHFPGSLGAGGLIEQVIVRFVAGVQASLPDFLSPPSQPPITICSQERLSQSFTPEHGCR